MTTHQIHYALILALAATVGYLLWTVQDLQHKRNRLRQDVAVLRADTSYLKMENETFASLLKGERECAKRWMTRALVSETDRAEEAVYLATVIRNRYERGFRGAQTYRAVVTDPFQFSAFNPGRPSRGRLLSMTAETTPYPKRWKRMELVAERVMAAPRRLLPFSRSVTHYLTPSRVSTLPYWYHRLDPQPAPPDLRFAFRKQSERNG